MKLQTCCARLAPKKASWREKQLRSSKRCALAVAVRVHHITRTRFTRHSRANAEPQGATAVVLAAADYGSGGMTPAQLRKRKQ